MRGMVIHTGHGFLNSVVNEPWLFKVLLADLCHHLGSHGWYLVMGIVIFSIDSERSVTLDIISVRSITLLQWLSSKGDINGKLTD